MSGTDSKLKGYSFFICLSALIFLLAMGLLAHNRVFPLLTFLAANLLCRLPDPAAFLDHLPVLVEPGGHMVFTTPCTWLEEFTPRDKWPDRPTIDWMTDRLGDEFELHDTRDVPFLIRETARKFQWTVALATLWKRRA